MTAHADTRPRVAKAMTTGSFESGESAGLVRPYARTRGRTRPTHSYAIEAMVLTSEQTDPSDSSLAPEHRDIALLCRSSRSVAEVSALMRVPIGVARVILGDMAGLGLVVVHDTNRDRGRPDAALMQRVLDGLHRI